MTKPNGIGWDKYAETHPGQLTDLVGQYRSGENDWPATKTALVNFTYAPAPEMPHHSDPAWYGAVETRGSSSDGPNTVDQLEEIQAFGGITRKELNEVYNEWQAKHDART